MNRKRVTGLVALAALVVPSSSLAGTRPAAAAVHGSVIGAEERESVLVSGTGKVFGKPDTLTANFAVETSAPTVGDGLDRANAAATRMRDALTRAGVDSADLQTSDVNINATRNKDNKIIAYAVSQALTAKIRHLPQAGKVLSTAIEAGGDAARLNGVSFAIEDDAALLTEARKKAFAEARAKAELYAHEAGRPLGRVVRVSEDAPGYFEPMGVKSMAYADAATPIEPGRRQLSVTVTVEWILGTSSGTTDAA